MKINQLLDRIIINPDIMAGKPIIKGTRVTVQSILGMLGEGITIEAVLKEYPHISVNDIYACLIFAQKTVDSVIFTPLKK